MKGKPMTEAQKAKLKSKWTPERRREASEAAKKRASSSQPSGNSGGSSGLPPSLPPTATERAASDAKVESLLEKLMKLTETKETEKKETTALRELPDEEEERESALRPARFPARVPVIAFDETFRSFGLAALSPQERDEGVNAFATLFWQWGLYRDGRVLVALWLFGVLVPRVATALRNRITGRKPPELATTVAPPPTTQPRSE